MVGVEGSELKFGPVRINVENVKELDKLLLLDNTVCIGVDGGKPEMEYLRKRTQEKLVFELRS